MKTKITTNKEKGAAAVEFALVLPLLVLLMFGIIEFGLLLFNKQVITNASREGARAGIIRNAETEDSPRVSLSEITTVVNNYCSNNLVTFGEPSSPGVQTYIDNVLGDSSSITPGQELQVRVTYHYDFLLIPNFITDMVGGIDMAANTTMRAE